jgi:hypothetical protein
MPGLWTLEMHPIGGEHYLLDKRTGSDRNIYLDWHTSQRGEKVVEIDLNGRPAMGIPFEVSMLRRRPLGSGWTNDLILQQLVTNGVGRLSKLPNGYYDVMVRPLAPGIPPVSSQLDLILCDQPVTNRFVFQGDVPVDHGKGEDFGDAPGLQTRRSDDGARHEIRPGWFLGVGVDPDADGVPSARADADDVHALDEGAVDLHLVQRQPPQVRQARPAGAEVVERERHAQLAEPRHVGACRGNRQHAGFEAYRQIMSWYQPDDKARHLGLLQAILKPEWNAKSLKKIRAR